MKAVIMAGGKGSRLRPLTCDIPKPMARICEKPVIEYILELLSKNKFDHAYITLGYLPNVIKDHFENKEYENIKLDFFTEETPLGTAGSVKAAAQNIKEPFLVISGDAMCDFDLLSAYKYHISNDSPITIIAKTVDDPREYGLINVKNGYVENFSEKPSWNNVTTNIANTGMYIINPEILDLVPKDTPYDFACDLFPKLLDSGENISVYVTDGYWCDIGDLNTLLKCQNDLLNGVCRTSIKTFKDGITGSFKKPNGNYKLFPPVYIGDRVSIGEGSIIGPNSTLESGSIIGKNSRINNSIVMKNSIVGSNSGLTSSILCSGASVGSSCSLFEGSVVGTNAVIGKNCEIHSNVYVWPHKNVEENTIVSENVKFANIGYEYFDDEGISGDIGIDMTPDFCARLGAAIGSIKKCEKIGVGCDHSIVAKTLKNALCSGIISTGIQVFDFGELLLSQANFAASFCGLSAVVYLSVRDDKCTVKILSDEALNINRNVEREITSYMQKCDFVRCNKGDFKDLSDLSGIKLLYQQEVYKNAPKGLENVNAIVDSDCFGAKELFEEIIFKLGCGQGVPNVLLNLSQDGTRLKITTEKGLELSEEKVLALCCLTEFINKRNVYLPFNTPSVIRDVAKKYNQKVYNYDSQSTQEHCDIKEKIRQSLWLRDGIQMAVRLLSYVNENNITIDELAKEIPEFSLTTRDVFITVKPSIIMDKLKSDTPSDIKGVISINHPDSRIIIRAGKKGNVIKLFAESYNSETATAICDDIEDKIAHLLDNQS